VARHPEPDGGQLGTIRVAVFPAAQFRCSACETLACLTNKLMRTLVGYLQEPADVPRRQAVIVQAVGSAAGRGRLPG